MEGHSWSISDVVKQTGIEPHVLRYWEKELHLNIPRNEFGYRYYLDKHIELFKQIHEMKEGGFQLKAIKTLISPDFLSAEEEETNQAIHTAYTAVGGCIPAGELPIRPAVSPTVVTSAVSRSSMDTKGSSKVILMNMVNDKMGMVRDIKEKNQKDSKDQKETKYQKDPKDLNDQKNRLDDENVRMEFERDKYQKYRDDCKKNQQDLENEIKEKLNGILGLDRERNQEINWNQDKLERQKEEQIEDVEIQQTIAVSDMQDVSINNVDIQNNQEDPEAQQHHVYEEEEKKELMNRNGEQVASIEGDKITQFKEILSDVIVDVLAKRDEKMGLQISDKVIKQMDYLMRLQDELEEERFKRLDETIRMYQKEREAVGKQKFFHKLTKKRVGH